MAKKTDDTLEGKNANSKDRKTKPRPIDLGHAPTKMKQYTKDSELMYRPEGGRDGFNER